MYADKYNSTIRVPGKPCQSGHETVSLYEHRTYIYIYLIHLTEI